MKLLKRLLLVLSIIFAIRVYSGSYDSLIADLLRSKINENSIPCQFNNLKILPPFALQIDGLVCSPHNLRGEFQQFQFAFQNVQISPAWKEVLTLSVGIKLDVTPLSERPGGFALTLARNIPSGKSRTVLDFNKFPLGSILRSGVIPGLAVDGELNGELLLSFSTKEDLQGAGRVLLENGLLSASGMEKSIIKLPMLTDVSISIPIKSTNKSVIMSPIIAASSFGIIKGDASINDLEFEPKYSFNGNLLLNELGMKVIGGFVALLAGQDISKPVEKWKIALSGDFFHPPVVKLDPIRDS